VKAKVKPMIFQKTLSLWKTILKKRKKHKKKYRYIRTKCMPARETQASSTGLETAYI